MEIACLAEKHNRDNVHGESPSFKPHQLWCTKRTGLQSKLKTNVQDKSPEFRAQMSFPSPVSFHFHDVYNNIYIRDNDVVYSDTIILWYAMMVIK